MPPSAETSSILSDVASTLSLRRILRRVTTKRSRKSLAGNSNDDKQPHSRSSSYISYSVYQQVMAPIILRDPDATRKLLDAILDSSNGRRSLSRLARTCKAMREPALDALWRELPSLLPLIGLFPSALMKKARKPGLGFTKMPAEDDWKKVLAYGERVRRIGYDEGLNNVASSIFTVIEEYRPRTYILPNLLQLSWKAETPIGLDRCSLFLNPELQGLFLEIGTRFPQLNAFLADMCSRTHLTAFSFISPMSLPDTFTELLLPQDALEKLVLVAPGALAPGIGKWAASLPRLRTLQLDLTGRSVIAVEGFFDDIRSAQSGASTPSSVGSPDSGVFSGDEIDFSEIRKASLRLTGDLHSSKGTFAQLTQLHLTGEASNIAVFMKHLTGSLAVLELVIEDPPDKADWQDLSTIISERFGSTLQSLRVTATGSSRFSDLVRSTSRMEPPSNHLSLAHFASLERLVRFEIDLPESIIFHNADMEHLAKACPNVEVVRLCPVARFPPTAAPYLTLEGLAPLMSGCRRLHTLAVVINAKGGSDETLAFRPSSSRSLLRLHVGHSWVSDPLQVTILLSHFAPHLELLKWYQEKNRPGFVEARAQEWQKVSDFLPYLQNLRLTERAGAIAETVAPPQNTYVPPQKVDKAIDATVITVDRGIFGGQFLPVLVNRMVEAKPEVFSISVDATPSVAEAGVYAATPVSHQSVDARPSTTSTGVAAITFTESKSTATESLEIEKPADDMHQTGSFTVPSVSDVFSFACRFLISYPLYIPLRILELSLSPLHARREEPSHELESEKDGPSSGSSTVSSESSDISPATHEPNDNGHDLQRNVEKSKEITEKLPVDELEYMRSVTKKGSQSTPATRQFSTTKSSAYISHPSYSFVMAEQKKQEKDYTAEVDALIPQATTLAQSGKLQDALDKLFALEKQTRNASDLASTTRLVKAVIERCYEARDYALLNSSTLLLSKKHGQLKGAVQAIVEQAMGWLEGIKEREGTEKWLELVETLRSVTEGKIFLETPRARVTLLLSLYHESLATSSTSSPTSSKESLSTASELLSDLQVETYSSMERREKTEFILEQMRLLIAVARQKDVELGKDGKDSLGGGEAEWVKVRVGGRKVNEQFLKEKENEDLKLKYYDLMIQHALHQSSYLDVAKYYYKVWETPSIKEDENDKGKTALEHIVYYVILSPHNNEQSDMLQHLFVDPALVKLDLHYNLVKCFTTRELMRWPGIEGMYGPFLRTTPVFISDKRWEDLHTRIIEHNIRVVAEYYARITLPRLTSLLDLTLPQTEETLARLVVSGTIWARVDRPAGIVNFRSKQSAEDVMNDWSSDMQKLLGLVEKTWMGMNAAQAAQSRVKA